MGFPPKSPSDLADEILVLNQGNMETLSIIFSTASRMFDAFLFKCIASACVIVATSLFGADVALYEALGILVTIDIITGVYGSYKKGEPVTSKRFFIGTFSKVILYSLFLSASWQLDRIISITFFGITALDWAVGFLGVTEFLSILENLTKGGLVFPKALLDRLHKILNTGEFK